jgi:hypothetical protein
MRVQNREFRVQTLRSGFWTLNSELSISEGAADAAPSLIVRDLGWGYFEVLRERANGAAPI